MKYACVTKHEQDSAQQLTTETIPSSLAQQAVLSGGILGP